MRQNPGIFGSLQIVAAGDFRQLKPVPNSLYKDHGEFCFQSEAWTRAMTHVVVLDRVMRQDEPIFIKAIHELSTGEISHDTDVFLETLRRPLPPNDQPTFLFARNYDVIMTCYDCLSEINGPEKIYRAVDEGDNSQLGRLNIPKKFGSEEILQGHVDSQSLTSTC